MVQYEELSDNAKKAIEQFRNCYMLDFASKIPEESGIRTLLRFSLLLNNVIDGSADYFAAYRLAYSKNYWLTDTKKEENK